ncbi:MAG TPA: ABC transporter substrate-binding protein [Candidatus Binatia bacterium]|nr:ABC transporter substrate-binding protein [Candidatus Binatia bacterium]
MMLAAGRLVAVLILLVSLVAKAESRVVNLAAPAASLSQIPFYVAQERGFFKDEGLDVNLIVMGAPVANLALIGQNVDFSSVPTAALSAMLRGAPLRVIFNAFYRPLVWLYSKADIRLVKELKGKRVGVAGIGSGPDHLLRELLRQNGMDPGRDVTILGLGVPSNLYTALSTGNIDASVFVIPWNFTAGDAGFFELVSFVHQDTVQFQGSVVVRDELMRTDPQVVEKFVRGTIKGLLYSRANRSGTIAILARNLKVDEKTAPKIYDIGKSAMTVDGSVNESAQKKALDFVARVQGLKDPGPVEKFFDFSLARKVSEQLQMQSWKP